MLGQRHQGRCDDSGTTRAGLALDPTLPRPNNDSTIFRAADDVDIGTIWPESGMVAQRFGDRRQVEVFRVHTDLNNQMGYPDLDQPPWTGCRDEIQLSRGR